jgi:two-component system, chemotaxis family, response regulator Rcp1
VELAKYRSFPSRETGIGGSNMKPVTKLEILLVEDNPVDVLMTQEALSAGKLQSHLSVVRDGDQALQFLSKEAPYENAPRPDLILLDLNLPRRDGREVLARIKDDPVLRRIPVIVLTTSGADEDIIASYDLHANCFITKPVDLDQFLCVIKSIEGFWLSIVHLPQDD